MENISRSAGTAPGLVPVSGAALYAREIERREELRERGVVSTGCSEIDDALLLGGGFERGCVVGVSAEELDFGVLLGLQTVARALVFEDHPQASLPLPQSEIKQRATIITTLPATAILPMVRDIVRCHVQAKLGPRNIGVDVELRRCLEAISISRIFDIEGLWEVLRELEPTQDKRRCPRDDVRNEEVSEPHAHDRDPEEKGISEAKSAEKSFTSEHLEEAESTEKVLGQSDADQAIAAVSEHPQESRVSSPERITELPPLRIGPKLRQPARRAEVLDSEDEEPLSSSPLSSLPPSTIATVSLSQFEEQQLQSPIAPEPQLSSSPLSSPPSTVAPESSSQSPEQPQPLIEPEPEPQRDPSPRPEPEERPRTPEVSPSIPTESSPPPIPDIILITHFSALLTALFTHSDKPSAHTNLQNLSSHLRHLARSAGSLIMLLNTTTSPVPEISASTSASASLPTTTAATNNPIAQESSQKQQRPLDATLRSIFNPAMPHHFQGPYASRLTRRNKPSFGATFAQFLDLHLLCTRVPRTRDDAETAVALGPLLASGVGAGDGDVRYAWVVEALLDEGGFWDWKTSKSRAGGEGERGVTGGVKGGVGADEKGVRGGNGSGSGSMSRAGDICTHMPPRRVNREQRWAAVDVRDRVAIVNAFASMAGGTVNRGPVRLAAGFRGQRV